MNLNLFFFLFATIGVKSIIRNGTTTLNTLLALIWHEGTLLIDFDTSRKTIEELKKTYTKDNGEISEDLFENEDYKRLLDVEKSVKAEIPELQNKISKLIDEFIDITNHNKQELKQMREELISNSRKIELRRRCKSHRKKNKLNKERLALQLTVIEEKERYTNLDLDMIQVLRNQTDVQGRFIKAYINGDMEQLESFRQLIQSVRDRLQGIYTNRLNQRPRERPTNGPIPFWNNLSLDDLRRINDWKETRIRLMQAIDHKVMRLSPF